MFQEKIRLVKPSLAFCVSYYGIEGMAFILACHREKVVSVDIQHGVQGDQHTAYASWPAPGMGGKHQLLPDWFWVWSDWEASTIKKWVGGTNHGYVVGGNPWLGYWHPESNEVGARTAVQVAKDLRLGQENKPVILFTLQYGLAPEEQLIPIKKFIECSGSKYAIWVRLHPAMLDKMKYVCGLLGDAQNYKIDIPTELPLQAVLQQCDVHVTHSSSTIIEAAQFGIKSLIQSQ
ncbi:hypothetical protein, partial [Sedimenticola sp.]|uniref:hypothetical protein n=1 Tax=Sedimenticola sp. TaxID=1940285 RepID=UPI003D0B13B5